MQHWAKVGAQKPAKTPTHTEALLRHQGSDISKTSSKSFGPLFGDLRAATSLQPEVQLHSVTFFVLPVCQFLRCRRGVRPHYLGMLYLYPSRIKGSVAGRAASLGATRSATQTEMVTAKIVRIAQIAPTPKNDFPKSIFAVIGFQTQKLQSEQSHFFNFSVPLFGVGTRARIWGRQTEKVKNCNLSNPSSIFQSEQSESTLPSPNPQTYRHRTGGRKNRNKIWSVRFAKITPEPRNCNI